jgi:uncharacterized membrane protein
LIAKKGDKRHQKMGRVYFWSMLISAIAAIPMSYLHPNWFLFMISIFTIYMLTTGVRSLKIKKEKDVKKIDWILSTTMLLFGIGFIVFGTKLILSQNNFGIVLIVFGTIGISFVYKDWKNFTGRSTIKNFYLTTHIGRMAGAYIASLTAFIVVNNHDFIPGIVAWLLPTFIITPLIFKWTRKYQRVKQ